MNAPPFLPELLMHHLLQHPETDYFQREVFVAIISLLNHYTIYRENENASLDIDKKCSFVLFFKLKKKYY